MKKLAIVLFLICFNIQAQTLEKVKKLDTLYFYFSANEYQKKNIYNDNTIKDSLIVYAFYKDDKELIRLKYSKYEDFDSMFAGIKTYKKY